MSNVTPGMRRREYYRDFIKNNIRESDRAEIEEFLKAQEAMRGIKYDSIDTILREYLSQDVFVLTDLFQKVQELAEKRKRFVEELDKDEEPIADPCTMMDEIKKYITNNIYDIAFSCRPESGLNVHRIYEILNGSMDDSDTEKKKIAVSELNELYAKVLEIKEAEDEILNGKRK